MKKLILVMAAAITLTAVQSFAHDKGKGKKACATEHCCKKETKTAVKKAPATAVKKA